MRVRCPASALHDTQYRVAPTSDSIGSPSTPKGRTTEQDSISEDDIVIQHEEGPKGTDSPQNTEPGPSVETDGESVSGMSEETYRSRTREVSKKKKRRSLCFKIIINHFLAWPLYQSADSGMMLSNSKHQALCDNPSFNCYHFVTYNRLAGVTVKFRVPLAISNSHQACWNYCEIQSSTCHQVEFFLQSVTYIKLAGVTVKFRVLLAINNLKQACWNYCEIQSSTCNQCRRRSEVEIRVLLIIPLKMGFFNGLNFQIPAV
ncbi:hypothetical protein ACHWQZ_G011585 [Mnemiopsis leidyi]